MEFKKNKKKKQTTIGHRKLTIIVTTRYNAIRRTKATTKPQNPGEIKNA